MGCCGNASAIRSSKRLLREPTQIAPPAKTVLVIVVGAGSESVKLQGAKTGRNYGLVHNGNVFVMAAEDFEGERRVLRATQDTLRMFT